MIRKKEEEQQARPAPDRLFQCRNTYDSRDIIIDLDRVSGIAEDSQGLVTVALPGITWQVRAGFPTMVQAWKAWRGYWD